MNVLVTAIGGIIAAVSAYITWRRHEAATRNESFTRSLSTEQYSLQRQLAEEQQLRARVQNLMDARALDRQIYELSQRLEEARREAAGRREEHELHRRGLGVLVLLFIAGLGLIYFGIVGKQVPWQHDAAPSGAPARTGEGGTGDATSSSGSTSSETSPSPSVTLSADQIAAQTAIVDYFNRAKRDDVDGMWSALSSASQRQSKNQFYRWWGPGVVDVQGPYMDFGSQWPITEVDGSIWVQFAVRFYEDHAGALPSSEGWLQEYDVYWYKLIGSGNRWQIDDSRHAGVCPFDLASLAACESALPLQR